VTSEVGPLTAQLEAGPVLGSVLPEWVRARFVDEVNGIRMHVLERDSRSRAARGGRWQCWCTGFRIWRMDGAG
jgi:hypothetical protein